MKATAAGRPPATNFKYLDINNVNARINTGGDMWWDFENGKYEFLRLRNSHVFRLFMVRRYRCQRPAKNGGTDVWLRSGYPGKEAMLIMDRAAHCGWCRFH
ncbi:MAG: hypothetical protein U5L09_03730 [Bacteroidales bacterium]|nr:hypothetical protein [Bacteroidales bacterium]